MITDKYRLILTNQTIKILKDHPPLSPILRLIDSNGQKAVWKDYSERSFWVKDTWGKILINHECYILKRLAGIKGIPRLIRKLDDYGFLAEYLEGEPLNKFKPAARDSASPSFGEAGEPRPALAGRDTLRFSVFDKLSHLIDEVHQRGIVHLDLGQRRNILLDKDYNPYFVDFANALHFRTGALGFGQLFDLLCLIDHSSLLKFKHRFFPHTLTFSEKRMLKWFFFSRKFWVFKPKKYRPKDRISSRVSAGG